jgi:putative FmdB family regulatory protein
MPIYEYQCEKCCHCFEILVLCGDDEEICCPECGHARTKRLMSSSCFIGGSSGKGCSDHAPKGFS